MRVVVVGASGNVGTALVRRMAASGEHTIVGVSRRVPERSGPYAAVSTWHSIDVGDPNTAVSLVDAFRGADAVVNFAWAFQPTRRPDVLYRTGVLGSAQVTRAAADAGVRHLVHTSSVGAYARRRNLSPVDESFPVTGVDGSVYSLHKATAEADLDRWENEHTDDLVVSRIRPGFVLQREAGAALFRYGLPGWLPGIALALLPILPLDQAFVIPVVHSDDVADAVARLIAHPVGGAFNLASDRFVTRDDVAGVLHARPVNLSPRVLETVVQASWRAHVQPLDAGWIRLAYAVPLLDSGRAHRELGWRAEHDPVDALGEAVAGMRQGLGLGGPVLRPRSWRDDLNRLVHAGPISRRQQP